MNNMQFKKDIKWNEGKRFAKLKPKQSKSGKTYYQADMNNFLLVSNGVDQWGNLDIKMIPIEYKKIEGQPTKEQFDQDFDQSVSGDVPV